MVRSGDSMMGSVGLVAAVVAKERGVPGNCVSGVAALYMVERASLGGTLLNGDTVLPRSCTGLLLRSDSSWCPAS